MGIKNDLNIKAQEIIQIIIRIHHFYDELKYLNSTKDTRELFFIKRNKFFRFSKVSLLICTILDLNTLYSTDDKYSLIKFLNTAKNRYTALNWSDKISKDTIDKWLETIIKQDQIIKKIKMLRNKHYAHIEFDQSGIKKTMPTYDEFETLITLASSIMKSYQHCINNEHINFKLPIDDLGSKELLSSLKDLDDYYKSIEDDVNGKLN